MWMLLGWFAHADVVEPGPICPPGSRSDSDHQGGFCAPTTCDGTCPDTTESCQRLGLCVVDSERACNGDAAPDCTFHHREAVGACEGPDDCAEGRCVVADRCAPSPSPAAASGGWGCAPGAALLVGGLPLTLLHRRRRRE
ncbi:MAG: hypothetical protein KC621_05985 [Myxococcales bacterium]|nr:hypothetical protein [Myxococcales bacterium]